MTPSSETVGRASSGPAWSAFAASRLALDDDDRAEALPVDDEHRPGVGGADEPDVTARQADERVGRDDGERRSRLHRREPGHRRRATASRVAVVLACDERSTTLAPAGGATCDVGVGDRAERDLGRLERERR